MNHKGDAFTGIAFFLERARQQGLRGHSPPAAPAWSQPFIKEKNLSRQTPTFKGAAVGHLPTLPMRAMQRGLEPPAPS